MIEHISFFYVSFLVLSSWERILKSILILSVISAFSSLSLAKTNIKTDNAVLYMH